MGALIGLVALLLATSRYGRVHSLVSDYVPHEDMGETRTGNVGAAPGQQDVYNASVQKCRCEGNEAWNGNNCLETETIVAVTKPTTNQVTAAPTSKFRVTVGEVRCSQDKEVKVLLEPSKDSYSNQFSLFPNGSLYWQWHSYENYCFDHTFDEGNAVSWQAKVCLPPPVMPRCCHSSSPVSNILCDTHSAQRFSPPISVNEEVLQWPGELPEKGVNVLCKENANLLTLPLNTGEARLLYQSGGVSLEWSSGNMRQKIQKEDYCVEPKMEGEGYVAYVCYMDQTAIHERLCSNVTCVHKCCPKGEIMYEEKCVPVGNYTDFLWEPTFTDANDHDSIVEPPKDLTWIYGLPDCSLFVLDPDAREMDEFFLLSDGKLFPPLMKKIYPPTQHCIENFVSEDKKVHTKALVCFIKDVDVVCTTTKDKVYPALLLVSSVFLGVTLVVYISIPEMRDKLHGRCVISLVVALFVAYTLLASIKLVHRTPSESLCLFLASVTHFSMLAAFFWLNVMCFDIWRTLKKMRTIMDRGFRRKRFLLYSLYAWGCPLLITVMAVIMDRLPPSHEVIRPNFKGTCWFQDEASHWMYLYGWMLALVVSNIIFFSLVAAILCKAQNNSSLRQSRDHNRDRMWLYVKLFLVMGVSWLAEVVSWKTGACRATILTNVINALQGLSICLVFVCKRSVFEMVKKRFGNTSGNISRSTRTRTTTTTSTALYTNRSNNSSTISMNSHPSNRNASPTSKGRNAPSPIPLQTLEEAADHPSELSHDRMKDTASAIPRRNREVDTEAGTAEEVKPLKTSDSTPLSRTLETHFDE